MLQNKYKYRNYAVSMKIEKFQKLKINDIVILYAGCSARKEIGEVTKTGLKNNEIELLVRNIHYIVNYLNIIKKTNKDKHPELFL